MRKVSKIGMGYRIAARLAALYLVLIDRTTRWRQFLPPETKAFLERGEPFVGCVFHSRLTLLRGAGHAVKNRPKDQVHVLISGHRDGVMIAEAARLQGYGTVIGSGSKKSSGGLEALRDLILLIEKREVVVITPDGPRGPNMRLKGGAFQVAQATGVPIIGATGSFRRQYLLKTWDRTVLTLPFGRAEVHWTKPLWIERDASTEEVEAARRALENEMIELTRRADAVFGHQTPEPRHDSGQRPKARKEKRQQTDARA